VALLGKEACHGVSNRRHTRSQEEMLPQKHKSLSQIE